MKLKTLTIRVTVLKTHLHRQLTLWHQTDLELLRILSSNLESDNRHMQSSYSQSGRRGKANNLQSLITLKYRL